MAINGQQSSAIFDRKERPVAYIVGSYQPYVNEISIIYYPLEPMSYQIVVQIY